MTSLDRTLEASAPVAPIAPIDDGLGSIASFAAYESFLEPARALGAADVEECCADVGLAYRNVKVGVANVLAREDLACKIPDLDLDHLRTLPALAEGLAFAVQRLQGEERAAGVGTLLDRAFRLRRRLWRNAESLCDGGLISEEALAPLRVRRDPAQDCLNLAALLRAHESAIAGHSPVTAADWYEARQVGVKLSEMLARSADMTNAGETGSTAPALFAAAEVRDRLFTLLRIRHDALWRCGAWIYGRDVDDYVPSLQARNLSIHRAGLSPRTTVPARSGRPPLSSASDHREKPRPAHGLEKVRLRVQLGVLK